MLTLAGGPKKTAIAEEVKVKARITWGESMLVGGDGLKSENEMINFCYFSCHMRPTFE